MRSLTVKDLNIGDSMQTTKKITEEVVFAYAEVTGDFNPQHIDKGFGKKSMFGQRIAHGMLSVGLISKLLGTELPGIGSIYMSQEVKFLAPVYFGDEITAVVEVEEIIKNKRVKLRTFCKNQDDVIVIDGHALILPPKEAVEE